MMRVLLVGQNMAKYNPTSLTDSFYRGFLYNNIKCDKYDLTNYITNKYYNYIVKRFPFLRSSLLQETNNRLLNFLKYNKNYTHIFVVKGTFALPSLLKEIKVKYPHIILSCYNPDDPFNPESWEGSNHANIKEAITCYDSYFIWSKKIQEKIENRGVKKTHYIPFAVDNKLIKKFKYIDTKYDLSFIGNSDIERQKWINSSAELIKENADLKGIDVFGLYWKPHPKITLNGGKFGDNYFKVFYQSKININILRNQNKGETNMRTFEIPATGNFMLHEYSEGAMQFFDDEKDTVYFKSQEELIDKAQFYLKNETLRLKIAQSGYEKLNSSGYTYNDKIKEIIKILK